MGDVTDITWFTREYEEEKKHVEEIHVKEGRSYHARRSGLGLCDDYRKSGSGHIVSGHLFSSATVGLRGYLRIRCTIWWACGCRYDRTYARQLRYYKDGDQLRIAVAE